MRRLVRGLLRRFSPRTLAEELHHADWALAQHLRRLRLKIVPATYLQKLSKELIHDDRAGHSRFLITLTLASRHLGHKYNRLDGFLRSFLEMTEDLQQVEILIKIDKDDDLIFFHKIKRKYQAKLNLFFLLSDRGKGYGEVFRYHVSLLPWRSPSSRIWVLQSDDALFVLPKWDNRLLTALADYPHDHFICTDCPFEEAISIIGPNPKTPVPVYWVRGDLFPVVGSGILRCTEKIAQKHAGWTSLGNGFNIDGFAGDLLRRLWQRHRLKLHIQLPTISKEYAARGWVGVKGREELRTKTLLKFFSKEDQMVRDEMVDEIAKCVKEGGF